MAAGKHARQLTRVATPRLAYHKLACFTFLCASPPLPLSSVHVSWSVGDAVVSLFCFSDAPIGPLPSPSPLRHGTLSPPHLQGSRDASLTSGAAIALDRFGVYTRKANGTLLQPAPDARWAMPHEELWQDQLGTTLTAQALQARGPPLRMVNTTPVWVTAPANLEPVPEDCRPLI